MKCYKVVKRYDYGNRTERKSIYHRDLEFFGLGATYPPLQKVDFEKNGACFATDSLRKATILKHQLKDREIWECEGEKADWYSIEELMFTQSDNTGLSIDMGDVVFLKSVTLTKFIC